MAFLKPVPLRVRTTPHLACSRITTRVTRQRPRRVQKRSGPVCVASESPHGLDEQFLGIDDSGAVPRTAPLGAGGESGGLSLRRLSLLIRSGWRLAKPFWVLDRGAVLHFVVCVAAMLSWSFLRMRFTIVSGGIMDALNQKNLAAFKSGNLKVFIVCLLAVPCRVLDNYAQSTLRLRWKLFLTRRGLNLYFNNRNYYQLSNLPKFEDSRIDNPDEVIDKQFGVFADNVLSIVLNNLRTIVDVSLYSVLLLKIFPPLYLFIICFVGFGTVLINRVGRRLVDLEAEILRRAADFRFALSRVRIYAESIAFYDGAQQELLTTTRKLNAKAETQLELFKAERGVQLFQETFFFVPFVIPALFCGPLYFKGVLQLGQMTQATTAFHVLFGNLAIFIAGYEWYASLGASLERLSTFVSALEQSKPLEEREFNVLTISDSSDELHEGGTSGMHTITSAGNEVHANGNGTSNGKGALYGTQSGITVRETQGFGGLSLTHVCVDTPRGTRRLIQDVTLTLHEGRRVLIVGQSGSGKTSLLRAVAGLWTSGSGIVHRAPLAETFFMPQRPYCVLGSLRDQLLYPHNTTISKGHIPPSDIALENAMREVELADLPSRAGGLDAHQNWSDFLSVGESQRLAFARLLIAKPRLVIIDEGTSAVDLQTEATLMRVVTELGATVVSVGHRPSLVTYHDFVLHLQSDSSCSLVPSDTFVYPSFQN